MSTAVQLNRRAERPGFSSEDEMVDSFADHLAHAHTPWGAVEFTREWDYRNGVTDVLARDSEGRLIAFEAKLSDWRRAAHQAYRNTVFAGVAYVVMPAGKAAAAAKHLPVFEAYGVGLCSFDGKRVRILIEAKPSKPLIPWLRASAEEFFDRGPRDHSGGLGKGRSGGLFETEGHASA